MTASVSNESQQEERPIPSADAVAADGAAPPAPAPAPPPAPPPAPAPVEALPLGVRRPVIKRRHKKTKDEIRRERAAAAAASAAAVEEEDPELAEARRQLSEELSSPDEFQEVGSSVVDWVYANRQIVLGVLGLMVFSVLAWGVARAVQESQREVASGALFEARKAMPEDGGPFGAPETPDPARLTEARTKLEAVASAHDGTIQADQARVQAGSIAFDQGEFEAALTLYDAATDADGLVGLMARSGRAAALEQLGRLDEAITEQGAVRDAASGVGREQATLDLARMHRSKGETDKARALYQQFLTEFGDSLLKPEVEARLAALGGGAGDSPVAPPSAPAPSEVPPVVPADAGATPAPAP